ncbi:YceI family protein [Nocardia nova]|uniref:YceI family protein n=1 Tax=Nocardia nova TaxID=37330 RepID=UPI0033D04353
MTTTRKLELVAGTWKIDGRRSNVSFRLRHLTSKMGGTFGELTGELVVGDDGVDITSAAEIAVESIDTGNTDRDKHLRAKRFLDADNFPTMRFTGSGIRWADSGYVVDGTLALKAVSRPVTLAVAFQGAGSEPSGTTYANFTASTAISRKVYGVGSRALLVEGIAIGDRVEIELEIRVVLQPLA